MRVLATAAFAFSGGIFLAQYLLPHAWQLPLCLICVALGAAGLLLKENARKRAFLIAAGLALGLAWNWAYVMMVQLPAEKMAGETYPSLSMVTLEYAEPTDYGARVTVRPEIEGLTGVRMMYYGDETLLELEPGCRIVDDAELNSASTIREDEITTFTSKGIFLLAYSRGDTEVSRDGAGALRWLPQRCAKAVQEKIETLFSGDAGAFVRAILTGDKTGVSDDVASDLSEAGLYHILAVSGMHCAYLLSIITLLVGKQHRRLRAAAAVPILLFYMLLAGCSPSVVRACVMMLFVLAAPLFRRESDMPTSMAAALMLILLQNPFAAASISLQLSFAAISGIIWVAPAIQKLFPKATQKHRLAKLALYSVAVSVGVSVCSAPLSAYYFNLLCLISPLSNLLCLWAAGIVFAFGLASVLAGFLWLPLGVAFGVVAKVGVWYILKAASFLASVPYHAVYFSNPYLKYWLLFAYALFFLCWAMRPKAARKYAVAAGLCVLSLCVTVWLGTLRYAYGMMDILMLDVGQGASMIVRSENRYGLIDCGSRNSWYDAGGIAADMLQSMGCGSLDYLMITHYDSDHVSGVAELLARIPVKTVLLPDTVDDSGLRSVVEDAARRSGASLEYVTERAVYPMGAAEITAYPPLGKEGDNQRGSTYLCSAGEYDLLVTGDMNSATEQLLLEAWELPDIEVLAVGHHGAASSTSMELLKQLKPETALISVGSNSYGHPTNTALRRLLAAGVEVWRTDLHGNIHISVN